MRASYCANSSLSPVPVLPFPLSLSHVLVPPRYVVERMEPALWAKVLTDDNEFRRQLIDQVRTPQHAPRVHCHCHCHCHWHWHWHCHWHWRTATATATATGTGTGTGTATGA